MLKLIYFVFSNYILKISYFQITEWNILVYFVFFLRKKQNVVTVVNPHLAPAAKIL